MIFLFTFLLLSHFSPVRLCATPQMAAHEAPPSLGFSRQEHWSGLPFPSPMHESEKWKWSHSVVSDSWRPHGLQPTRLLSPWDFPGKSTGVGVSSKGKTFELYNSEFSGYNGFFRSFQHILYLKPGERNGNPLQYSCLENPMDWEAW